MDNNCNRPFILKTNGKEQTRTNYSKKEEYNTYQEIIGRNGY